MQYVLVYGIMFLIIALISWRWVEGIDYMQKNHPDYTGDDLFGINENKKDKQWKNDLKK